jgi:hypothetical protein
MEIIKNKILMLSLSILYPYATLLCAKTSHNLFLLSLMEIKPYDHQNLVFFKGISIFVPLGP